MKIQFYTYSREDIDQKISQREGELKLGEQVLLGLKDIEKSISNFNGRYVVLGVCEDIGPRANFGRRGSDEAFDAFLNVWLNMQNNRFSNLDNGLLLGRFEVDSTIGSTAKLRVQVEMIDKAVGELVEKIFLAGKIPIVIGGGHNNAFPIISAYHKVHQKKLKVINLDPHADFRPLEGRHSGNSFSYAMDEEFLKKYGVIGLHKAYNSETMLKEMDEKNVFYTFFDDYLKKETSFLADTRQFLENDNLPIGVELDLDSVENMPSSAMSPMGWTQIEARKWLMEVKQFQAVYYHFPEGAPRWGEDGKRTVGKFLSYLINDIIAD